MASTGAKAKLLSDSLNRLDAARAKIQTLTGVQAPELPQNNRDADLLTAYRIEALAGWSEDLIDYLTTVAASGNGNPQRVLAVLNPDGTFSALPDGSYEFYTDEDGTLRVRGQIELPEDVIPAHLRPDSGELPFADPAALENAPEGEAGQSRKIDSIGIRKPSFDATQVYLDLKSKLNEALSADGLSVEDQTRIQASYDKKIDAAWKKWLKTNGDADG